MILREDILKIGAEIIREGSSGLTICLSDAMKGEEAHGQPVAI